MRARRPIVEALFVLALAACAAVAGQTRVAAARSPIDDTSLIQSAQHEFEMGNYLVAIKSLQAVTAQNYATAEAFFWLGRSYYELRDYDNAVVHTEKAVALDGGNSVYHQWLGRAYGGKADRERSFFLAKKVKKELVEAVRLNPSNIEARLDLEDFCMNAPWIVGGNHDEAREQAEAIASIDHLEGHVARGKFAMDAMKRPDLAEKEFQQIVTAKANRLEPYLEAIAFYQKEHKLAEMGTAIQAAEQARPNDPRVEYFQGVQWVLAGVQPSQAEEYLKSYLASTPERSDWPSHAAAREWLGRLYESQGKTAEAVEQYRAALQIEPGRKEVVGRLEKLEKGAP